MQQLHLSGKRVIMRVDFNVPINTSGIITDATRIEKALASINYILEQGASLQLLSHLGRPLKKLKEDGSIDKAKFSLAPVAKFLSEKIGREVSFIDDCIGAEAVQKSNSIVAGEVVLLENTRFYKEEKKGDALFAKKLADLADVYINDAFGTAHRAHASTAVIAQNFDADAKALGLLMQEEIKQAEAILKMDDKPFTAIMGGAKVSDKLLLIDKLIDRADHIIIGGGMAYTIIKAKAGNIGNSIFEEDRIDDVLKTLEKANQKGVKIHLPVDSIIADDFSNEAKTNVAQSDHIPDGWMGLDIGPKARVDFSNVILNSKAVIWNGPMGVFEMSKFEAGTQAIADSLSRATQNGSYTMVGGGDSVAAINKLNLADKISFVSTGGGAMLEYLEGKDLPGIVAITS